MSEASTSAKPESARGAALKALDISLLAALWFLARYMFYDSFYAVLGIPADLGLTPAVSVPWLVFIVAGLLGTLNVLLILLRIDTRSANPLRKSAIDTAIWAAVCWFLHGLWIGYLGHPSRVALSSVLGVFGIGLYLEWIHPLVQNRETAGYANKLQKSQLANRMPVPETEGPGNNIYSMLAYWGGATGRSAMVGLLLSLAGGHYFGRKVALEKRDWVEVIHPALPAESPDRHWILIARSDANFWVVSVGTDGKVYPDIRAVPVAVEKCRVGPLTMKASLHPAGG